MRKVLLFLCISFSVLNFSQNIKGDIENQFREYSVLIENKNFDKALDKYGNEDYFKIFPKEQVVALMNQMFNSQDVEVKIYQPQELVIGEEIIKQNNNSFLKLTYRQNLDMKFNVPGVKPEKLLSALRSEFGPNQVSYDESTRVFEIKTVKETIANSSDLKNWKFTVIEKKQIPILIQFIPESLLRSIN
ncbi:MULTISPECIES: hypothetical protein [unclassified Kaistella]|uniref:hypothetical protein n=1 Tax=unclassified Kaistella TaxID=2762626 RepID=UPI0027367481|nr:MULTISPECIES: hypothetical protein [unclassified Kaistella]MDP2454848.1 hypothetical protein [Kaistella sp. SH11-4b]MDP2457585.1 hypothetical protein [Kaistella sp. SH40-3]MDP2460345.1 hypothetical protein [Kaistella sp. SH19-2b]